MGNSGSIQYVDIQKGSGLANSGTLSNQYEEYVTPDNYVNYQSVYFDLINQKNMRKSPF